MVSRGEHPASWIHRVPIAPFGSYRGCPRRAPMGWGSSHACGVKTPWRGSSSRLLPRSGGSSAPATPLSTSRLIERKVAVGLPSDGNVSRAPWCALGTAPPPRASERALGGRGGVASPPLPRSPTRERGFIGRRPGTPRDVQRDPCPRVPAHLPPAPWELGARRSPPR